MLSWLPWRQAVVFIFSAEGTIKNVQSRDNANVGHIGHRKKTNKAPKKKKKKDELHGPQQDPGIKSGSVSSSCSYSGTRRRVTPYPNRVMRP